MQEDDGENMPGVWHLEKEGNWAYWSPSTDISAAWQVWFAVVKDHPEDWAIYSNSNGEVTVEHYPDDYKGDIEAHCGDFRVDGVFPEAMCKAALLADLNSPQASTFYLGNDVEKLWKILGLSLDDYMMLYWDLPNKRIMAIDHRGKHTPVGEIYDIVTQLRPIKVRPGIGTNVVSFKVRKLAEQLAKEVR